MKTLIEACKEYNSGDYTYYPEKTPQEIEKVLDMFTYREIQDMWGSLYSKTDGKRSRKGKCHCGIPAYTSQPKLCKFHWLTKVYYKEWAYHCVLTDIARMADKIEDTNVCVQT